jgi:hypothetical protein
MEKQIELTPEQYSAVRCAISSLDGTAGGYTDQEKRNAKQELLTLLTLAKIKA